MVWENLKKDYTTFHKIEYPPDSKKWYIFDPYSFGIGMWRVMSPTGKPTKVVERNKQLELNEFFFAREELPSMYNRFMSASKEEREKLKEISIGWLQIKIRSLKQNISIPKVVDYNQKQFSVGRMYFFVYDPKLKEKLPKWDALPLTIVLDKYEDGFLGLNIHYLEQNKRMMFLTEIMNDYSFYNKSSDVLSLRMKYKNFKNMVDFKNNSVCVKRYLNRHIRSKILPIESHEWSYAAVLPVQQFKHKR